MELEYDPLVSFGRHLAATRRKAGVSQEALAHDSGLSRSYVSGIERGLRNVALRNICVLAETLKIPPSVLLEFDRAPADIGERKSGPRGGSKVGGGSALKRVRSGPGSAGKEKAG